MELKEKALNLILNMPIGDTKILESGKIFNVFYSVRRLDWDKFQVIKADLATLHYGTPENLNLEGIKLKLEEIF